MGSSALTTGLSPSAEAASVLCHRLLLPAWVRVEGGQVGYFIYVLCIFIRKR